MLIGGLIIGAIAAGSYDIFVNQGVGLGGANQFQFNCIDWVETLLYSATGGLIGLPAAPLIGAAPGVGLAAYAYADAFGVLSTLAAASEIGGTVYLANFLTRDLLGQTTDEERLLVAAGVFESMYLQGQRALAQANQTQPTRIEISRSRHPEAAQHIEEAQNAGLPSVLTIDRPGTSARRAEALRGIPTQSLLDRDEYPPAVFLEGGAGSSVKLIVRGDNRGAGGVIGQAIKDLLDGTKVVIIIVD